MPDDNGGLFACKERASAGKPLFPRKPVEAAAQLLLNSPGAAQILRAPDSAGRSGRDLVSRRRSAEHRLGLVVAFTRLVPMR